MGVEKLAEAADEKIEVIGELQPLGKLAVGELTIDEHPVGVGSARSQTVQLDGAASKRERLGTGRLEVTEDALEAAPHGRRRRLEAHELGEIERGEGDVRTSRRGQPCKGPDATLERDLVHLFLLEQYLTRLFLLDPFSFI